MSSKSNPKKIRSVTIFPLHLGGSNGPKLELDAIFTPPYNAARYGIRLTSSPHQADVVLLIGSATPKMSGPALELLAGLPEDVKLVQLGSEATSGAPFSSAYGVLGPLLPPDPQAGESSNKLTLPAGREIAVYVAGSPPDPLVIIDAILKAASA